MNLREFTSDTTRERESSKLMDTIEPMEESSTAVTTFPNKGKAELDLAEETEESGDESEEDSAEETDESEEERTRVNGPFPQWDVDSFEGEYDSSEEYNEFSDEEHHKLCLKFNRVLFANKGFYVPPELRPWCHYSRIRIIGNLERDSGFDDQSYRDYYAEMARLCLERYNQENRGKNGFTVELVEVVRVYFKAGKRLKSYITFTAKEQPDGPLIEYQAKAWTSYQGETFPILCRPAPPPMAKP